jgi:AraC-like DNA-binding protein
MRFESPSPHDVNTPPPNFAHIQQHLERLGPPASLFSGACIRQSLAPDNIVFFQRTDAEALRTKGVSNNYHHRFELVSIFQRPAPVRIDRKTYLLQPGECVLIFPNQFHHFLDITEGKLEWLFITFECASDSLILSLRDSPRIYDQHGLDLLGEVLCEFITPAAAQADHLALSHSLARLLRHLSTLPGIPSERQDIHSSDDIRDVILESINRYVRRNLHRGITIRELAKSLDYSVSHLRAVFRDRLGVSLGRYMRESRLSEAAKLLQAGQLSVREIGEKCGFESLFAFSRAFRNAYGIPPREYRQLVMQGSPLPIPQEPL